MGIVIICLIIVKMFNGVATKEAGKVVKDVKRTRSIAVLHLTDSGPPYMRDPLNPP